MTDRAFSIHLARVYLAEAARRRHSRVNRFFYWSLISSAQRARRAVEQARDPQGRLPLA